MNVCEVGLNHLGSADYSSSYIEILTQTKCDAITYQVREASFYAQSDFESLALDANHYERITSECHLQGKLFGIALADHSRIEEFESYGVDFYKVLSWDIAEFSFIESLLHTNKPIFVSTGMASSSELDALHNWIRAEKIPSERLQLIHTQLTFDTSDVNLKAIKWMRERYPYPVAYGNHCEEIKVIYTAVAYEPSAFFIYVKNSPNRRHIDERHAVPLSLLPDLLDDIQHLTSALGTGDKLASVRKHQYLIQNQP